MIVLFALVTVRLVLDILITQSMIIIDERAMTGVRDWTGLLRCPASLSVQQQELARFIRASSSAVQFIIQLLIDGLEPHLGLVRLVVSFWRRWRRAHLGRFRDGRRTVQGCSIGCSGRVSGQGNGWGRGEGGRTSRMFRRVAILTHRLLLMTSVVVQHVARVVHRRPHHLQWPGKKFIYKIQSHSPILSITDCWLFANPDCCCCCWGQLRFWRRSKHVRHNQTVLWIYQPEKKKINHYQS